MAGIFDPVTLPEPAPASPQLRSSGTPSADYSGTLRALANALEAGGAVVDSYRQTKTMEEASQKISAVQDEYLTNLTTHRANLAELESLKAGSPEEGATYESAAARIKTLQDAISSRQMNPGQALSRIESIRREAMIKAPKFANYLKNYSGTRGETFDHETEMALERIKIRNKNMAEMELNPNNPGHVKVYQEIVSASTRSEFLVNQEVLTSRDAATLLGNNISSSIQLEATKIDSIIESSGGIENLPSDVRSGFITNLQQFTNGNEHNIVEQFLQTSLGPDKAALVDDKTRNRYAALIKANADYKIAQLNGEIPKTISSNERELLENRVMNNLAANNPAAYHYIVLQSQIPGQSLGGGAVQEAAGIEFLEYFSKISLGKVEGTGRSDLESQGLDPKETQGVVASKLNWIRGWFKDTDNANQGVAESHFKSITTQAKALATNPTEYSPKLFDEMISTVNDDKFMSKFKEMDPDTQQEFVENMRTATQTYARENMAVDMNRELNKEIWVDFMKKGRKSGGMVPRRELVTPTVTSTGALTFIPVSGLTTENDVMRANMTADRLNKMYTKRTIGMVNAAQKLAGLSDDLRREFTVRIFADAMGNVAGEPLKVTADEINEREVKSAQ